MSEEIKRCPFCGGAFEWSGRLECWVCGSADSGCEVDVRASRYISEEEQIKALNTRPIEDALQARIEALEKENVKQRERNATVYQRNQLLGLAIVQAHAALKAGKPMTALVELERVLLVVKEGAE